MAARGAIAAAARSLTSLPPGPGPAARGHAEEALPRRRDSRTRAPRTPSSAASRPPKGYVSRAAGLCPAMRRAEKRPRRTRVIPGRPVLPVASRTVCDRHVDMINGDWICSKCKRSQAGTASAASMISYRPPVDVPAALRPDRFLGVPRGSQQLNFLLYDLARSVSGACRRTCATVPICHCRQRAGAVPGPAYAHPVRGAVGIQLVMPAPPPCLRLDPVDGGPRYPHGLVDLLDGDVRREGRCTSGSRWDSRVRRRLPQDRSSALRSVSPASAVLSSSCTR